VSADVVVVGGGATGACVARDAAMRGFSVVLVEAGELASATTGHFHGQLHSGARYAVQDPGSARECWAESGVLRRIARSCIDDTGGLFVLLAGDDDGYPGSWFSACLAAGIPVEEVAVAEALRAEPALTAAVARAFRVPDAVLDARRLVERCAASAVAHGGRVVTGRAVTGLVRAGGGRVAGVTLAGGEDARSEVVVNAAGAWAGRVAALAGCPVGMRLSKGVMVATRGHCVSAVISRCRFPADGDILVPVGDRCVMGTTDEAVEDPDDREPGPGAVARMGAAGDALVPGYSSLGSLSAWAAVRPLVEPSSGELGRGVPRSHRVIDHAGADGVEGLVTVVGGKATTCRLMAEETVDLVCRLLDAPRPCRTALEAL